MSELAEAVEAIVALIVGLIMLRIFAEALGNQGYLEFQKWEALFFLAAVLSVGIILIGIAVAIMDKVQSW